MLPAGGGRYLAAEFGLVENQKDETYIVIWGCKYPESENTEEG